MGVVRSTILTGVAGVSTIAAYLASRNPVVTPLASDDPVWKSKVYKRQNPSRNPATQDICTKRLPISMIKPELLKKDGDLVQEFCRGVWGGLGYAIQRKYLEHKYRGPDTAHQLWTLEQLRSSNYEKGTQITDHFEVLEKTLTSIIVRAGDTPRKQGLRPSDGLFVISATVDKVHDEVELSVKSVFFSSEGKIAGKKGNMPRWVEELHQWYSRILNETGSWRLLK
ncbi:hypothetical protein SEPCBS119000_005876 [Sporothrix epigloea]|uniref:Tim44-like domain-containing protein n=1 Tax=Sporothrix epigloea TaxID=1892477 RepID=A0ABP0E0A8_9PEZI